MIVDLLDHAMSYRAVGPRVSAALNWLRRTDLARLAEGRHELDGDRLFAMVARYQTKPLELARWEAHRRYLDVQCVVAGVERVGYAPLLPELPVAEPYDPLKDIVYYEGAGDLIHLRAGQFAIFGPQDVHAPGLAAGDPPTPGTVLKVVVKCRVVPPDG